MPLRLLREPRPVLEVQEIPQLKVSVSKKKKKKVKPTSNFAPQNPRSKSAEDETSKNATRDKEPSQDLEAQEAPQPISLVQQVQVRANIIKQKIVAHNVNQTREATRVGIKMKRCRNKKLNPHIAL
ncbi:hypothetical protein SESBI_08401 [Sesbania bispinosa]|nr:hypothetical protein SESBI_08401 [Sesbania bispinosa]